MRSWGIGLPQVAELAHALTQRSGRVYSFSGLGDAMRVLRRELKAGRKSEPHAINDGRPSAPPATKAPEPVAATSAGAPPSPPVIEVHDLSYTYRDGSAALRGVSLTVPRGQFLILAGPNGSGKTTLAKHFNGLLKPGAGRVIVDGNDTKGLRVPQLARVVGYVFQNPDHQIFAPTVSEEIAFGLRLQGLGEAETERRVAESLANHELTACAGLPPATLSLGQRRQVTLASVLATRPAVLVLDEPTGGLDWRSREELMARVDAFHGAGGTVILITHDVRLIAERGERVVLLLKGLVRFDGLATELFTRRELMRETQLTAPPMVRLAQRLSPFGVPRTARTPAEIVDVLQF